MRPSASLEAMLAHGAALQASGREIEAAQRYQRVVAADPDCRPALVALGHLLIFLGLTDEGVATLERAQKLASTDLVRLMIAMATPVIHSSIEDAARRRVGLEQRIRDLADSGMTIDTENTIVPTNFYAAYDGLNDRDMAANLGRIFKGPSLVERGEFPRAAPGGRIRVGFISAYFRNHTIGRLNLGRIQRLDRDRFEVVVLSAGNDQDPATAPFKQAADIYVPLPATPAAARRLVADQKLDILLFTDVGMDPLVSTLAFSRMAPVQCATWGHPVTTGSSMMDYFISSELLEVDGAEDHYTEELVRLPSLGIWYPRPEVPKARIDLGLEPGTHVYACPQTLSKLHPTFDPLLAEILRRDPRGVLVLIEGRLPTWTQLTRERIARLMPDVANRIRWIPALPRDQFLGLLRAAHVILDPITFGGGNTSYEALAMGTPLVTSPRSPMRTRLTRALYASAGQPSLTAPSPAQYAELVLSVAAQTNPFPRRRIRSACGLLFETDHQVRDLERLVARHAGA